VASSDQDALTNLSANANAVTVFGQISAVSNAQITVEQITFNIGSQTTISDDNGKVLLIADLKPGQKVNVVGTKDQQNLVAQKILVTDQNPASQGEVKSASTGTTSTSSALTLKKTQNETVSTSSTANTNTSTLQTDPNTATGFFMFEDPTPQMGK
jgi:hypothetical protein